ncbi:hypothetical protein ES703_111270 [subsurface metagenome]
MAALGTGLMDAPTICLSLWLRLRRFGPEYDSVRR